MIQPQYPSNPIDFRPGMVWLVGAGPGDPDLLTRKASRLISMADIVFHDALVGDGILGLVEARTRLVCVGKRSGRHSKAQFEIDTLLVEAAQSGMRVVRLKGGDPAIFGRADEELRACRLAGVPVAICPGVTAASAASAGLGQSLTLRGLSRKLVFAAAHMRSGDPLDLDWRALADPGATLAFYMGKSAAGEIARQLIAAGLPPDTPAALVENASLPEERHFHTRLDLLQLVARSVLGSGPAVILIGLALRQQQEAPGRLADQLAGAAWEPHE